MSPAGLDSRAAGFGCVWDEENRMRRDEAGWDTLVAITVARTIIEVGNVSVLLEEQKMLAYFEIVM